MCDFKIMYIRARSSRFSPGKQGKEIPLLENEEGEAWLTSFLTVFFLS